jgi:hypothetical protein
MTAQFRDDYTGDVLFDPDDVDLSDLIDLSVGIHGEMCPEITPESAETLRVNWNEGILEVVSRSDIG